MGRLVSAIEAAGGEAIYAHCTEHVNIIAESYFRKWSLAGAHFRPLTYRALWLLADTMDGRCRVDEFGLRPEHAGESFENLMKIFHLVRVYPDLALFVQASPAFCCPSMVTEAMARDNERLTGAPVVSITCDGQGRRE